MTTIPALDPVTDILDTDLVMVTNAQGNSYTIAGSELNKRNKIIMASNTTVTGAPLKAGGSVRIYFSADITANDGNTVMQINYNGVNYYVKAPKDGGLINFVAHAVGNVYKYVQAYTTLEMLFDGNQFVIIGNPVVISNSDYVINADGSITYSAGYCASAYKQKPFIANTHNSSVYYEFDVLDGRYYYLTVIRSVVIYKYRIWYFGGGMFSQLLLSENVNPIVSIDLNTTNKCKVTVADWDYITVMWEEESSGLHY